MSSIEKEIKRFNRDLKKFSKQPFVIALKQLEDAVDRYAPLYVGEYGQMTTDFREFVHKINVPCTKPLISYKRICSFLQDYDIIDSGCCQYMLDCVSTGMEPSLYRFQEVLGDVDADVINLLYLMASNISNTKIIKDLDI